LNQLFSLIIKIVYTDAKKCVYKSNPINIPALSNYHVNNITIMEDDNTVNNTESYYLKCSHFNPDKASPPNDWNSRLKYRLEKY
jgi:hypothetical protein